jgi:hypothetical protein
MAKGCLLLPLRLCDNPVGLDLAKKRLPNILPNHFLLSLIVAVIPPGIAPRSISIGSLDGCESDPSLEGWLPTPSAISHCEALSSEKASVDGPRSRTEHRHTSG